MIKCGSDRNEVDWEKGCGEPVDLEGTDAREWRGVILHDACLARLMGED